MHLQISRKSHIRLLKLPTLLFLFLLLFVLGTLQNGYIINLLDGSLPLLISRNSSGLLSYPLDGQSLLNSFFRDPRWVSFFLYTAGFFVLSMGVICVLFKEKAYTKYALFIYSFLALLSLLLIALSFITNSYDTGYKAAQHLKDLYQSPLLTFILITFLYFLDKQKKG
jgi:hypothetical protein